MPAGHKADYLILASLAALSAVMMIAFVTWGWIEQEQQQAGPPSTYSDGPGGAMACYMLLERLGQPVRRLESPLLEETLGEIDVLLVIEPVMPVHPGELAAIRTWVKGGGVLVCAEGSGESLKKIHGLKTSFSGGWDGYRRRDRETPEVTHVEEHPGRGPAAAPPLHRDLARLQLDSRAVLESEGLQQAQPLLADEVGARIAARRLGDGMAIVLAEGSFLTNARLGKADNAVLAANLIAYALWQGRGKRIGYDEYHFGYGAERGGWTILARALVATSPGWGVLALTVAGVMYLLYRGRRFGTRLGPQPVRRRSKLEFVHSVGATYRACGANRTALEILYGWFRRRAADAAGVPASTPTGQLLAALARRKGAAPARWQKVLSECDRALAETSLSSRRLSGLVSQLAQLEAETKNGHARGKPDGTAHRG
jgi:hypothetical protein